MLGAKRRFGQSTDCPAQSMDLRFAQPIHGLFWIQTRVSERSFPAAIQVYRSAAMVDREAIEAFVNSSFVQTKKTGSKVLTRSRGAEIVAYLSGGAGETSAHFKFWVKSRCFLLMDYPVLGLSNVLCLPAKPQKKVCCAVQKSLCTTR